MDFLISRFYSRSTSASSILPSKEENHLQPCAGHDPHLTMSRTTSAVTSAGLGQGARPPGKILPLYGLIPSPCAQTKAQHPQQNRARTRLMQLTPALPAFPQSYPAPRDCRKALCDLTPLCKAPAEAQRHNSDPPHAVRGVQSSPSSHTQPMSHHFTAILRKQTLSSHPILTHVTPGQ